MSAIQNKTKTRRKEIKKIRPEVSEIEISFEKINKIGNCLARSVKEKEGLNY